jgi:photosystem II stability/assembly factor-like uncharacterized protein
MPYSGFATIMLLAISCAEAVAGVNSWTPVGPDGGDVRAVAFHPTVPGVVLAVVDSQIYRSTDTGMSWTLVYEGIENHFARIVIDPLDPTRVMVGDYTAIYRSDDAGLTFEAVTPPGRVWLLVVAPDGSAVYATTSEMYTTTSKVFRSTSFGAQWEDVTTNLPAYNSIFDFEIDPTDSNTLYALIQSTGLFKSTDAGLHWTLLNPLTNLGARNFAVDPGMPSQMLLATMSNGLLASFDGGVSWTASDNSNASIGWVGYHPSQAGAAVVVPVSGPVLRRAERSLPWAAGPTINVTDVGEAAFDPFDTDAAHSTLLAATSDGPMFSQDGGATLAVRSQGLRGAHWISLAAANYLNCLHRAHRYSTVAPGQCSTSSAT